MAILDKKVSEIYSGRDISSLSDRPNEDGLQAPDLKARFDQLGKEVIPNFNDLIEELNGILNGDASDIDALQGRMDNAEIDIDGLELSRMLLTGSNSNIDVLSFFTETIVPFTKAGQLRWNEVLKTLELKISDNVTLHIGKEILLEAMNDEATLISNGQAVYVSGGAGTNVYIKRASTANVDIAQSTIGVAIEPMQPGEYGHTCTEGIVNGINTNAWEEGDKLYLGIDGALTNVEPTSPTPKVFMGVVLRKHLTLGSIYVKVRAIPRMAKLSDVFVSSIADGHALIWNGTTGRFENEAIYNKTEVDALVDGNMSGINAQLADIATNVLKVENKVKNGNFSDGVTSWTTQVGHTLSNVNGAGRATTQAGYSSPRVYQGVVNYTPGNKIFMSAKIRIISGTPIEVKIRCFGSTTTGTIVNAQSIVPVDGEWKTLAGVITIPTTGAGLLVVDINVIFNNTVAGNSFEVDDVIVVDLTETFGAGKEISKEIMTDFVLKSGGYFKSLNDKIIMNWLIDKIENPEKVKDFPTSDLVHDFGGLIEHEWRTSALGQYVMPKIFMVDGKNKIFSSTDYGQTWTPEIQLDSKFTQQFSNNGHRLLFKESPNNVRGGVARVYTDDFKLVSETGNLWLPYNESGADGKPGVDGVWVFGEYVSSPQGGNLGLGLRVLKTVNNGITWVEKFKIMDVDHIHSCRYDPYNRNHIYINTGDANLEMRNRWYASYNDGDTWEMLSGGNLNEGKTPLIDGTFAHDKYMRTTALQMGVDSGVKGKGSIFYFHDNGPTAFVRYDKALKKFQILFDNLEGVAYTTTATEDGMFTITQTTSDYDILHYVLFPKDDIDIDNPSAYKLFTVKLPKLNYRAMRMTSSRQIDLAGNVLIGPMITYYTKIGNNLTNNKLGASIGIKLAFNWYNDINGQMQLAVNTKPIMQRF